MSSQPIHLVANAVVKEGKIEEVLQIAKTLTEAVHKEEPGMLTYYCFHTKTTEGKDQLVFVEKYANEEAQKNHASTPHYVEFGKQVHSLLEGPPDVKVGSFVAGFESRANL